MATRKERLKAKNDEKQQREILYTRLIVAGVGVIILLVIAAFVLQQSGAFSSGTVPGAVLEVSGTITAICDEATPAATPSDRQFSAADQVLEQGIDYRAIMCTDAGPIYLDLFEEETPVTVNNFVFLAQYGYFNNTIFHRVLEGFMAQGGDPTGTGTGGPGYRFQDEFVASLTFDRPYLLAMANAGPGTNGSQFFITFAPTPHLNNAHTIFGEVISGQQSVSSIRLRDPNQSGAPATTLQTVIIVTDPELVQ